YLLRVFDVYTATFVAVAINVIVGGLALLFASATTYDAVPSPPADRSAAVSSAAGRSSQRAVYITIALSGFTALGAEVIWTRVLSLLFGGTVYTFALILAVFLIGLGIGSTIASGYTRDLASPRRALGWCQLLLCAAFGWAAYQLNVSLPYWPINPSLASTPWTNLQLDMVRCVWVVLPGAILWGASFPLALASLASSDQDAARLAGGVYAANTVGAIAGSLVSSFVLIPWIGTERTQQVMVIISAVAALLMLEPSYAAAPAARTTAGEAVPVVAGRWRAAATVMLALAMVAAGLLARSIPPIPGLLVAY